MNNIKRAKIIVNGLVQGVGYRYFVMRHAENLGLNGYTQNLFTGEVLTEVEGDEALILELIKQLKIGPSRSHVVNCFVEWSESKNEFSGFEVKY
ncbi:MAG TPA: acylphosphatase [Ignavibacteriaceae bacterium]|jgi:acylphosphatase|nr:MAG: Acylphosphatase [Ignavibacteria bacterium ADurb.Bin266]OQY71974.1 MAG: acylphosphatase [Ignavibacteriales bacterium UTCHB2]HQF41373.1 acylphosphatase [Ignavibacteriaceae bacterium]HQI41674.1 acylphosphatase [Ignavibacteriaceae bacterium]